MRSGKGGKKIHKYVKGEIKLFPLSLATRLIVVVGTGEDLNQRAYPENNQKKSGLVPEKNTSSFLSSHQIHIEEINLSIFISRNETINKRTNRV